jgi:hypothetical protein
VCVCVCVCVSVCVHLHVLRQVEFSILEIYNEEIRDLIEVSVRARGLALSMCVTPVWPRAMPRIHSSKHVEIAMTSSVAESKVGEGWAEERRRTERVVE